MLVFDENLPGWMIPPMKGCLFPQQEIEVLPADAGDAAESCIGEQCPVEFDLAFFSSIIRGRHRI